MNILDQILEHTRQEVASAKKIMPIGQLKEMPAYSRVCYSLQRAIRKQDMSIIAEIKKASPSKGVIRENFDPWAIAQEYVFHGADAISMLTEKKYFQGSIRFISDIRASVSIPILRKDFIVDSYQLAEAKAFGADAVLLIASALDSHKLHELHEEAAHLGLESVVEVHNEQELESLNLDKTKIIGINNRNLSDFTVDISNSLRLAPQIPQSITIVSESGISHRSDLDRLKLQGIHAVLIGETFMRAEHPGKALQQLRMATSGGRS